MSKEAIFGLKDEFIYHNGVKYVPVECLDEVKKELEKAKDIFLQLDNLKHHGIDEECWRWEDWLS